MQLVTYIVTEVKNKDFFLFWHNLQLLRKILVKTGYIRQWLIKRELFMPHDLGSGIYKRRQWSTNRSCKSGHGCGNAST
jgi:hypothetical protein